MHAHMLQHRTFWAAWAGSCILGSYEVIRSRVKQGARTGSAAAEAQHGGLGGLSGGAGLLGLRPCAPVGGRRRRRTHPEEVVLQRLRRRYPVLRIVPQHLRTPHAASALTQYVF